MEEKELKKKNGEKESVYKTTINLYAFWGSGEKQRK